MIDTSLQQLWGWKVLHENASKKTDMEGERWEKAAESTRPSTWIRSSRGQETGRENKTRTRVRFHDAWKRRLRLDSKRCYRGTAQGGKSDALAPRNPRRWAFPGPKAVLSNLEFYTQRQLIQDRMKALLGCRYGHPLSGSYWRRSCRPPPPRKKKHGIQIRKDKKGGFRMMGKGTWRADGPWAWQQLLWLEQNMGTGGVMLKKDETPPTC